MSAFHMSISYRKVISKDGATFAPAWSRGGLRSRESIEAQFGLAKHGHFSYNAVKMTTQIHLGEFEQLILLAILRLRDDAYGVTIRSELAKHAGRDVAPGAMY